MELLNCDDCEFRASDVIVIDDKEIEITTGCNVFNLPNSKCECIFIKDSKYYNDICNYKQLEHRMLN